MEVTFLSLIKVLYSVLMDLKCASFKRHSWHVIEVPSTFPIKSFKKKKHNLFPWPPLGFQQSRFPLVCADEGRGLRGRGRSFHLDVLPRKNKEDGKEWRKWSSIIIKSSWAATEVIIEPVWGWWWWWWWAPQHQSHPVWSSSTRDQTEHDPLIQQQTSKVFNPSPP